jgi:hypothetical protein
VKEYEQTQTIEASPDEVITWLSNVDNLPEYLPPVIGASIERARSPKGSQASVSGRRSSTLEAGAPSARRDTWPWTKAGGAWSGGPR